MSRCNRGALLILLLMNSERVFSFMFLMAEHSLTAVLSVEEQLF